MALGLRVLPFALLALAARPQDAAEKLPPEVAAVFAAQKIHLDLEAKLVSIPAEVCIREDLLEYLLVNPHGAVHESLFVTPVGARELNTALLLLGAKPGENATWIKRDPAPTLEEMRAGAKAWDVAPPKGDGFFLYAAWKVEDDTYFFRVEDLICDRSTGASMRRHSWVYLGSRWVKVRGEKGDEQGFAAELEGNLVNLALFEQGNTLATASLPECVQQTIWMPNGWLVPERHSQLELIFSRERLDAVPKSIADRLPVVEPAKPPTEPR